VARRRDRLAGSAGSASSAGSAFEREARRQVRSGRCFAPINWCAQNDKRHENCQVRTLGGGIGRLHGSSDGAVVEIHPGLCTCRDESLSAGPPVAPMASQRASLSLQANQTHRKVVPPRAADPADHRPKSAASGRRHEQGAGGTSTARALRRPRPPEPPRRNHCPPPPRPSGLAPIRHAPPAPATPPPPCPRPRPATPAATGARPYGAAQAGVRYSQRNRRVARSEVRAPQAARIRRLGRGSPLAEPRPIR
jgi:hypothetical protein